MISLFFLSASLSFVPVALRPLRNGVQRGAVRLDGHETPRLPPERTPVRSHDDSSHRRVRFSVQVPLPEGISHVLPCFYACPCALPPLRVSVLACA